MSPSNCPRCSGRIYLDREDDDWACLTCGWRDNRIAIRVVEEERAFYANKRNKRPGSTNGILLD